MLEVHRLELNLATGDDGKIIAVSHSHETNIYRFEGQEWVRVSTLSVEQGNNSRPVVMSGDGKTLIFSSFVSWGSPYRGAIDIWKQINGTWLPLGTSSYLPFSGGPNGVDNPGYEAISDDGSVIAFTSREVIQGYSKRYIKVYEYKSSRYKSIGQIEVDGSNLLHISLAGDGKSLAVGANSRVKVYSKSENQDWQQVGSDISQVEMGSDANHISLSKDGSRVVIGDPNSDSNFRDSGQIKIFELTAQEWKQLGTGIFGEKYDDLFGAEVHISDDGTVVASIAPNNDGLGTQGQGYAYIKRGHAQIFTTAIINTHARNLVDDVLTGSTQFSHNSFDAKFYNLGGGRYGVQKKGESTIDEITGVSSLQFQDQALSLANDVAATFNQVKGMDDVSGVVFRLYNAAFARLPDAKGLENWINGNSSGGMTYATSAQEFSSSQEFKNRYGANTTDTQYITTLYNNVLERSPDAAGLANYQGLLANGKTRGALLLDFSESPENRGLFTEVTGLS